MTLLGTVNLRRTFLSLWSISAAVVSIYRVVPARSDTPAFDPAGGILTLGMLADGDEVLLPLQGIDPPPGTAAQRPSQTTGEHQTGQVLIHKYTLLKKDGMGNMVASGGVEVVYTDPVSKSRTTLTAQEFTYNRTTGQGEAQGAVRMERTEAALSYSFIGQHLLYNFQTQSGTVTDALLVGDYFILRGKSIIARSDGTYLVEQGEYTTCLHTRSDYRIRAGRMTVKPGHYISARSVIFYAGPTKLIYLPTYRRNLKTNKAAPIPLPGYDNTDGLFLHAHDTPIEEEHHSVDYDARLSVLHLPFGLVGYVADVAPPAYNSPPPRIYLNTLVDPLRGILEQITPPTYTEYTENSFRDQFLPRSTFDAVFQNNMGVYNRQYTDLTLTRAEIAVRFINVLGNRGHMSPPADANADNPQNRILGDTEAVLQRVPNAPFLLDVNFALSDIHEMPTNVTAGRFSFHSQLATQPLILGRRISLRAGISNWFGAYTTGTLEDLTSPEVAMDYVPTRTSRIGVAYRYVSSVGSSPFEFDARDIRNELRLQYQVSGPWAFGVVSKIDLDHSRAYDTELAVLRNFDCMQVGVNYRFRSQSFNIIFNLLPPTPDRARRRLMPINAGPVVGFNQLESTGINPNAMTALTNTN